MKNTEANVYRSHTTSRQVHDIVCPGIDPETIEVTKLDFAGDQHGDFAERNIEVTGQYKKSGAKDAERLGDDDVAVVGYDQIMPKSLKAQFPVRGDFDIEQTKYFYADGIIRVEVPKLSDALRVDVDGPETA